MLKKTDLLKLISEPQRGEDGPASRYALHLRPEIVQAYLAESYTREVERRGGVIENPEDVNAKLRAVARWLTDGQRKPFLMLYGENPGTGKTTLARAIYRVLTADIPGLANRLEGIVREDKSRIHSKKEKMIKDALGPELFEMCLSPSGYKYTKSGRSIITAFNEEKLDSIVRPEHPELYQQTKAVLSRAKNAIRLHDERLARLSVPPGDSIKFVSSGDIVSLVSQEGHKGLAQYYTPRILFLDDVGAELDPVVNYMGNKIAPIAEIIYKRYDARAVTIITANIGDETLAERYGPRIADRLNEIADKIAFMGNSYRK